MKNIMFTYNNAGFTLFLVYLTRYVKADTTELKILDRIVTVKAYATDSAFIQAEIIRDSSLI